MENRLQRLTAFKEVLSGYSVSAESKVILAKTKLALFVAPTSSGRNTIIRELVKTGEFEFIVSDTTRRPRVNDGIPEANGVEYWFRSEDEVLSDLKAGKYLEAAVIHNQQVSGISIRELERIHDSGRIGVTDIEIIGVHNIVKAKPDTHAIFILPPSFEEWQRRLKHRGDMDRTEIRRRMESAAEEYAHALQHDYYDFIINDKIENALEHIYIRTVLGFKDLIHQLRGRELCERLYVETQAHLKSL